MAALSLSAPETARKSLTLALKALATPGKQAAIASAMGISESAVSKKKSDQLEDICTLLAYAGLQVVPTDYEVVDPFALEFLKRLHAKVTHRAPDLLWEPDA